jgi:hypothetical protein
MDPGGDSWRNFCKFDSVSFNNHIDVLIGGKETDRARNLLQQKLCIQWLAFSPKRISVSMIEEESRSRIKLATIT